MSLTTKDLDDMKKVIEQDPNVRLDWITSEDVPKLGTYIMPDNLTGTDYIHFDSGHDLRKKTNPAKWVFQVMELHNNHPTVTLQNASIDLVYRDELFSENSLPPGIEFPPPLGKNAQYTIRRGKAYIDKHLRTRQGFDKFRCKYLATQVVDKNERGKKVVTREIMKIGDMPPNSKRYLIFKGWGWCNRLEFHGDTEVKEEKKHDKKEKE